MKYRDISDDEIIQEGDEYYGPWSLTWQPVIRTIGKKASETDLMYRRPIVDPPKQEVGEG